MQTREERFSKRDQVTPEIVAFSRCVLAGEEPEPSGVAGLADIRVIRALLRSLETGQPVTLGAFEKRRRPDLGQEQRRPPVRMLDPIHAAPPSGKQQRWAPARPPKRC